MGCSGCFSVCLPTEADGSSRAVARIGGELGCGPETWQGLGVQIEYHGPVRLVGHGGTFPGFDAAAYVCPETARSAVIFANTNTSLLRDQLRKGLGLG